MRNYPWNTYETIQNYGLVYAEKYYEHSPPSLAESEQMKPKLDTTVLIDKRLESNRPDIRLVHKGSHEWIVIDVAVHWDTNIVKSEQGKVENYEDPARQIGELNQVAAQVFSLAVGAFVTISSNLSASQDNVKIPGII